MLTGCVPYLDTVDPEESWWGVLTCQTPQRALILTGRTYFQKRVIFTHWNHRYIFSVICPYDACSWCCAMCIDWPPAHYAKTGTYGISTWKPINNTDKHEARPASTDAGSICFIFLLTPVPVICRWRLWRLWPPEHQRRVVSDSFLLRGSGSTCRMWTLWWCNRDFNGCIIIRGRLATGMELFHQQAHTFISFKQRSEAKLFLFPIFIFS